jgi:hypothetical protein
MVQKHRNISLATESSRAQLNEQQLTSYLNLRRLIDWLLNRAKDLDHGHGYAQSTVNTRTYRLDRIG